MIQVSEEKFEAMKRVVQVAIDWRHEPTDRPFVTGADADLVNAVDAYESMAASTAGKVGG